MPVFHDLAAQFQPLVRVRGEQYFRAGRAHLTLTESDLIEGNVLGSKMYAVSLRRDGSLISMSCTCPYIEEFGTPCKHLWAAILAADDIGHTLVSDGHHPAAGPVRRAHPAHRGATSLPGWRRELRRLQQERAYQPVDSDVQPARWPADRQLLYVVDTASSYGAADGVVVELATRQRRPAAAGGWGPLKRFSGTREQWSAIPDAADREIAQMLLGAADDDRGYGVPYGQQLPRRPKRFRVSAAAIDSTLRRICDTGRCRIRFQADHRDPPLLAWDDAGAWRVQLRFAPHAEDRCRVEAVLARGDERLAIDAPVLLSRGVLVLPRDDGYTAAPFHDEGAGDLTLALQSGRVLSCSPGDAAELAAELAALYPQLPPMELPEWLGVDSVRVAPTPRLALRPTRQGLSQANKLDAAIAFDYAGTVADGPFAEAPVIRTDRTHIVYRDADAEAAALARLAAAGFKREYDYLTGQHVHRVLASKAARVALELTSEGWVVELEGRTTRRATSIHLGVTSGIDWFDLAADTDFGGVSADLPELLAALRRGDRKVTLRDGSLGILPDEWITRYGPLAALGTPVEHGVRFARGQAALLDALLASVPEASTDALFERARDELRRFEGATPLDPPPGFVGELRPYQREGLGWLEALRRFGLGGILADDMGLGKTVQALALLEMRRQAGAGPSLVVVPRSLVFNWEQEAARFTPALRVLVHHGPQRRARAAALADHDLVLTTYGTLRRDVTEFRDVEFDHVILDEAQAIKNASTATAKAARLLRARHRLAMSGTPIENRLAELWSLFEFINPGLLGASAAFQRVTRAAAADGADQPAAPAAEARALVARAVRPFITRRTKQQVASDLPAREEQTLWVDLGPAERRLYDELRDHYRASLRGRIEREGLGRARVHVLEALLRLRQAACHPGLIAPDRAAEPSSKLDVLLSRLGEAVAEGHKALVFSQFTSLLAIVRQRLDTEGLAYEYLDGRTRDRKQRVEHFQTDPAVPLFLISLKAGGLGLNLTAADYVFLLDPWWNPAAEAQAIDRAHRIGQTKPVLAARLVARDTVEEKVIELQRGKRELADAIIRADDGLVARLTREDLDLLLA